MSEASKPSIQPNHQALVPGINVRDAAGALEFYCRALGAVELFRMPGKDGRIMHAEIRIGDMAVMVCDEAPDWGALSPESVGGCPISLNLYVEDCDAATERAAAAGATVIRPPETFFWGERAAMILDPYGYRWSLCTIVEKVGPEEVAKRAAAAGW